MATTTEGTALTEAHRRAQIANAAVVAALVSASWGDLDISGLATATSRFLQLIIPQIELGRRKSALLAVRYAEAFRRAELGGPVPSFAPLDAITAAQIEASMRAVAFGPAARLSRKLDVSDSPDVQRAVRTQIRSLKTAVGGTTTRYVADGGRATLFDIATSQDRRAFGYQRVTRDKPCYFCAALASRGPVYQEDSFDDSDPRFEGEGRVKVHDSCHCSLEVVYSRTSPWPGRGREFEKMWKNSDGTLAGFRRLYEGGAL